MTVRVLSGAGAFARESAGSGWLPFLALAHAAVVVAVPSPFVVAIGLWWNANTISHNFIHRPFFRTWAANRAFSAALSVLLGIPQSYWRERHLLHHGGDHRRPRITVAVLAEAGLVAALWITLTTVAPRYFVSVYLPGYLAGLGLCWLQGHYEHAGGTTSYYGRLYNVLFLNDGYHVEHHRRPAAHWTDLPGEMARPGRASQWPPVLRWMETCSLEGLERLALRSARLRRFLLARHAQAFRTVLAAIGSVRRVTIVGGGLFPRTALVLRQLLPGAEITVLDQSADNLAVARGWLDDRVRFVHAPFDAQRCLDADLVVIPLDFHGRRQDIYERPPAPAVIVHDWIWAPRPGGARVSWCLLKRLNLATR
jgi:hypothetical protein